METIESLVDSFYEKVLEGPGTVFTISRMLRWINSVACRRSFSQLPPADRSPTAVDLSAKCISGMAISKREFGRFTEHLIDTLKEVGVEEKDAYEIISHVNLYSHEITNDSMGAPE